MRTSESASQRKTLHFSLRHLSGVRKGTEERFQSSSVSIGRGRNNHCSFDAEKERSVSHRHCEIRVEGTTPVLYDIGSLNGTYVNGRRVRRTPLANGDEIGLGREGPRLRFQCQDLGVSAEPAAEAAAPRNGKSELVPRQASTSYAPRPERPAARKPRPSSRVWLIIGAVGVLISVLTVAGLVIHGLVSRLDRLEAETTQTATPPAGEVRPPASPPVRPTRPRAMSMEAPGGVPSGARGATVLVWGMIRDARGRRVASRELGAGVVVGSRRVLTTREVLDRVLAFREVQPLEEETHRLSIVVLPAGRVDHAVVVVGYIVVPRTGRVPVEELAALELEEGTPLARVLAAPASTGVLKYYPPGQQARAAKVTAHLDEQRAPVARPADGCFTRCDGLDGTPGLPLFSGTDLVALGGSHERTELGIGARTIRTFLGSITDAAPHPFSSR